MGLVDRVVAADEVDAALAWRPSWPRVRWSPRRWPSRPSTAAWTGHAGRRAGAGARSFVEVFGTEDAAIGVASFLEHGPGKATFTGR